MKYIIKHIVVCLVSASMIGCASGTALQRAQLKTAGVIIVAKNGQLIIRPFEPFRPIGIAPSACYTDAVYSTITPILFDGPASAQLKSGIKAGAVPVKLVFQDGRPNLFGRLLFCPIDKSADAYGISEYEIYIPDEYIRIALSGKLTSVYAKTDLKSGFKEYTWILWMSKDPI